MKQKRSRNSKNFNDQNKAEAMWFFNRAAIVASFWYFPCNLPVIAGHNFAAAAAPAPGGGAAGGTTCKQSSSNKVHCFKNISSDFMYKFCFQIGS